MKSKKGYVILPVICFMGFISVASLFMLQNKIAKKEFVDFYKKESFNDEVREIAQEVLYDFKISKLDTLELIDDTNVQSARYRDDRHLISYDKDVGAFELRIWAMSQENFKYYKYKIIDKPDSKKEVIFSEL